MCRIGILFVITLGISLASANPKGTLCGVIPAVLIKCLNNPKLVESAGVKSCSVHNTDECAKMTCLFRESDWLTGNTINKAKVTEHFDKFASEHPQWTQAVQHTKTVCLGDNLPPQGIHTNCPAYDVTQCALISFIQNAPASQWSQSAECEYPRQFAAACPVCPTDCFAPAIPIGSCNACYRVPKRT